MRSPSILVIFVILLSHFIQAQEISIDSYSQWQNITADQSNTKIRVSNSIGGIIDLMGNGGLMLIKTESDSLYTRTSGFETEGHWHSKWIDFEDSVSMRSLKLTVFAYGKQIDMSRGWVKFSKNPILSGGNTLLPLNEDNITEQTILLPDPGGVPQDQAIVKGINQWEDKWVLLFNHTPAAWPNEYYWSMVVADSLSPLKKGINPFYLDTLYYPLFGPIDNHAPNDWLDVDGTYYAPDENNLGNSHMWTSTDLLNWNDIGEIVNINGSDPGMIYDGRDFYLFNESENQINYNLLDQVVTNVLDGAAVLDVGGHTGDADVAFFNNRWHMVFDDGPHLHYEIGYASTTPENFPIGWSLIHAIYGPHNPEQDQVWDDDTKDGNLFGTGDADLALEDYTLYMFTERPVGAAYKELFEIFDGINGRVEVKIESDLNNDGIADDSTNWFRIPAGQQKFEFDNDISGNQFRVHFKLITDSMNQSPIITDFTLSAD